MIVNPLDLARYVFDNYASLSLGPDGRKWDEGDFPNEVYFFVAKHNINFDDFLSAWESILLFESSR